MKYKLAINIVYMTVLTCVSDFTTCNNYCIILHMYADLSIGSGA